MKWVAMVVVGWCWDGFSIGDVGSWVVSFIFWWVAMKWVVVKLSCSGGGGWVVLGWCFFLLLQGCYKVGKRKSLTRTVVREKKKE